jgi:hypothetical protein
MTGNWRKSSRSGANGACVEARLNKGLPQIRDSKLGDGSPILDLSRADLRGLLAVARR